MMLLKRQRDELSFSTTCHKKYSEEPVKIKESFGTSQIFLIHCKSLILFLMIFCLLHGQAITFKLHLEGSLLHLGLTMETSHVFVFLMWMNGSDFNSRLDRCDSQDVAIALLTNLFCFSSPILPFLCRNSKYLCKYVNQGDKNDRKPFSFLQLLSYNFMFYC